MIDNNNYNNNMGEVKSFDDAKRALEYIIELYDQGVKAVRKNFHNLSDAENDKGFYPYVWIKVNPGECLFDDDSLAYGSVDKPGVYGATITKPEMFYNYLLEQFSLLIKNHNVTINVCPSNSQIPLPYAISDLSSMDLKSLIRDNVNVSLPNLVEITDEVANCNFEVNEYGHEPLSLFSAERVDFSLDRLYHYTGTEAKHFQSFILLTNYNRYMNEFIDYAVAQIEAGDLYDELVLPNGLCFNKSNIDDIRDIDRAFPNQMPAYHLKTKNSKSDNNGITLINIGVGPSNAKNITDHLAVLRPHCWIMVGHCAGLRNSQRLGDYVLGHAYVREDQILNYDLSKDIPIPPIAEIQIALQKAVQNITGHKGRSCKSALRTGTVFTTADRNWEFRANKLINRFRKTRAVAVDMESATIAANGYRFRVPYATLLCISDKPFHGELKMRGMANKFYQDRVHQHLLIGIETINIIRNEGVEQLHSRKLRGFDDPPFL